MSYLALWLTFADRDDGLGDPVADERTARHPGSPMTPAAAASVEQRLPNLDKRNRQREQENEVLRRATA